MSMDCDLAFEFLCVCVCVYVFVYLQEAGQCPVFHGSNQIYITGLNIVLVFATQTSYLSHIKILFYTIIILKKNVYYNKT